MIQQLVLVMCLIVFRQAFILQTAFSLFPYPSCKVTRTAPVATRRSVLGMATSEGNPFPLLPVFLEVGKEEGKKTAKKYKYLSTPNRLTTAMCVVWVSHSRGTSTLCGPFFLACVTHHASRASIPRPPLPSLLAILLHVSPSQSPPPLSRPIPSTRQRERERERESDHIRVTEECRPSPVDPP